MYPRTGGIVCIIQTQESQDRLQECDGEGCCSSASKDWSRKHADVSEYKFQQEPERESRGEGMSERMRKPSNQVTEMQSRILKTRDILVTY